MVRKPNVFGGLNNINAFFWDKEKGEHVLIKRNQLTIAPKASLKMQYGRSQTKSKETDHKAEIVQSDKPYYFLPFLQN